MPTRAYLRTQRIRKTTDELADALLDFRYYRDKVQNDRRFSEELKAERIEEAREHFDEQVAEIKRTADKALERAKEDTAAPGLPKSNGAALLLESQKARAWSEHVKPLLDAGKDPSAIASRLVKKGDKLALQTLADNLPTYLETEPAGSSEFPANKRIENYMGAVREHQKELYTPDEAVAHEAFTEANRAHKMLQTNLGLVRQEQEGREPVQELWRDDAKDPLELKDL